jgi:Ca2+-binding RTX toxin-like protein
MRRAVLLALLGAAALPGAAGAGNYSPPPGDRALGWSPNGQSIAFETLRGGHALASVNRDGSDEKPLLERSFTGIALAPDWSAVAFVDRNLYVSQLDGTGEHVVAGSVRETRIDWSPDSKRVAFQTSADSVAVVSADGSGLRALAPGADPAWSPDGSAIAFQGGSPANSDIHVIAPDGTGNRTLADGPGAQLEPRWSPDGTRIAFLTQPGPGEPFRLGVVGAAGAGLRTYPGPGVSNPGRFSWAPDGRSIYFLGSDLRIKQLTLPAGAVRRTAFDGVPIWSPDGSAATFTSGGECRDRLGVYAVNPDGHGRRITNDCRIVGTAGNDTLRGTDLADVLVGLAGNDRLFAVDSGYVGDTLRGGTGNDVLSGGFRLDTLAGGPGDDLVYGGPSGDTLTGGTSRDHLNGQGGRDTIYAADGQRDWITCGTNAPGTPERDTVSADRHDVVARDCEIVHRA